MKTLRFIIGSLEVGGAERHLIYILPFLKEKGFSITVRVLSDKALLKPILEKSGIKVITGISLKKLPSFLQKPLRLLLSFSCLIKDFLQNRHAIYHTFLPEAYLLAAIAARLTFFKGCFIMSRRSLNDYQKRRPFLGKIEPLFHPFTTFALGNSEAVVKQLKLEGIPEKKIGLIYNGIDLKSFNTLTSKAELRKKLGIPSDSLVFIIVANLIPYKGHADLLNAFHHIHHHLTMPWKLLCAGKDNGILSSLKMQAVSLGISKNIEFLGSRSDTKELLSASDIGILCSHEEGFSNTILEGMAAELPMVVTNVGGNAEAVINNKTGLVVPAKNPELLAKRLLELALSPDKCKQFGDAGKKRVTNFFNIEKCVNQYVDLYQKLGKIICKK